MKVAAGETRPSLPRTKTRSWPGHDPGWRPAFWPRVRDRRFWVVQLLVVGVAVVHDLIERYQLLSGVQEHTHSLSFVPVSLFFVPVVYAALNFGLQGSVATALWATVLALPNVFFLHHGIESVGEVVQLAIVNAVAVFVGQRVDRETRARQRAEAVGTALRASELKHRGLFESSPVAVLVLDLSGVILEANPAASRLFHTPPSLLRGVLLSAFIGPDEAGRLLEPAVDDRRRDQYLVLQSRQRSEVYLQPTPTWITDTQGKPMIQLILRDVSEEVQRRAGLRAYAASIIAAQEDERKRIAQELHDQMVQQIVLLCRHLDAVESAHGKSPGAKERVRDARKLAEEVVQGLRDFARALRPPMLDDLGLVTSIRRLLVDLSERAGIEGQVKVLGDERRLRSDAELGLYRIIQEALRNVEHHARAGQVTVTVAFSGQWARVEVVDNGVGVHLPSSVDFATSGYLGLLGMQERAELLGGTLEIHSRPGYGTRVSVAVPEDSPAARPAAPGTRP